MNHLPNGTVAVGAPGSIMRAKAEAEDVARGICLKAYETQPYLTLAINADCNAIGSWDPTQDRYVMIACQTITGQWVSMPYEIRVNGKLLPQTWNFVEKGGR